MCVPSILSRRRNKCHPIVWSLDLNDIVVQMKSGMFRVANFYNERFDFIELINSRSINPRVAKKIT